MRARERVMDESITIDTFSETVLKGKRGRFVPGSKDCMAEDFTARWRINNVSVVQEDGRWIALSQSQGDITTKNTIWFDGESREEVNAKGNHMMETLFDYAKTDKKPKQIALETGLEYKAVVAIVKWFRRYPSRMEGKP